MSKNQSIAAQNLVSGGLRIRTGIHLHEDSGQLFEVIESFDETTEILHACFLSGNLIHAEFETAHLVYLVLQKQINFIGEV